MTVSGDLSDAIGKSHQSNPYRVQLLQLERAILDLGDVVRVDAKVVGDVG